MTFAPGGPGLGVVPPSEANTLHRAEGASRVLVAPLPVAYPDITLVARQGFAKKPASTNGASLSAAEVMAACMNSHRKGHAKI